jgi:hypothetical protein
MKITSVHLMKRWPVVTSALATVLCFAPFAGAQSMPAQNVDTRPDQNRDARHEELVRFDQFLDNHREIDEQLRRNPSLVDNPQFVKDHPALRDYLRDHPGVRDAVQSDPNAFMHQEERLQRHDDELGSFNRFLQDHRETADRLRRDPNLANDPRFVNDHPELQAYLQQHPGVREQLSQDPNRFMAQEDRIAGQPGQPGQPGPGQGQPGQEGGRPDARNAEVASFNRFLEDHREIADRLRSDPSRADDPAFVNGNPALKGYLQDHPGVADQLKTDPNAFMAQEDRIGVREDRFNGELEDFNKFLQDHKETAEQLQRDPSLADNPRFLQEHPALQAYLQHRTDVAEAFRQDPNQFMAAEDRYERDQQMTMNRGNEYMRNNNYDRQQFDRTHSASFGEFLGAHGDISAQLSEDPNRCKSPEYLQNHPELQSYLNEHPEVRQDLANNPQAFVKSAQQFNAAGNANGSGSATGTATVKPGATATPAAPAAEPTKPKQ